MPMSKSIVVRASALSAVLGGLLWDAKIIYESNNDHPYPTDITDALFFVVPLLMLSGLAGLYLLCRGQLSEQEKESHWVGFVLGFGGLVGASVSSGMWALGLISDVLVGLLLGVLFVGFGLTLFGSSIIEAGLLGRWKALPMIMGLVSILAVMMPPWNFAGVAAWALLGLGWAGLGYVLWSYRDEPDQQSALVRRRAELGGNAAESWRKEI